MAEEVKAVHREPHPYIGKAQILNFVGRPVAFVGRIDRFEDNTMYMKTHDGKSRNLKRNRLNSNNQSLYPAFFSFSLFGKKLTLNFRL